MSCFPPIKHGYPFIPWTKIIFDECVWTPIEQASFWIGMSSLGCWIFAQFPQVIENYNKGDASSLSPFFLLQWFLGDSLNLIGAILTGQLPTQILTAVYYLTMDFVLCGQYIYYTVKNRISKNKNKKKEELEQTIVVDGEEYIPSYGSTNGSNTVTPNKKYHISFLFLLMVMIFVYLMSLISSDASQQQTLSFQRKLLEHSEDVDESWPPNDFRSIIGYIIGCFSAAMYLGSRLPQIFLNCKRRSTEGLSLTLFICAWLGNFTYSLSIFLYSTQPHFILNRLPWIFGSAGVLVLDFSILMQFLLFRVILKRKSEEVTSPTKITTTTVVEEDAQEDGTIENERLL